MKSTTFSFKSLIRFPVLSFALIASALNNVRDATQAAYAAGGLTEDEYAQLKNRDILRDRVIAVDDFPFDYGRAIAEEPLARAANG